MAGGDAHFQVIPDASWYECIFEWPLVGVLHSGWPAYDTDNYVQDSSGFRIPPGLEGYFQLDATFDLAVGDPDTVDDPDVLYKADFYYNDTTSLRPWAQHGHTKIVDYALDPGSQGLITLTIKWQGKLYANDTIKMRVYHDIGDDSGDAATYVRCDAWITRLGDLD